MQQSTAGRGFHNNQTRRFTRKSSDVQYSVSKRPRDRITDFLFSTSRLFAPFHIVGPHWSWKCNSVAPKRQTFIKTIEIRQHVGLSRNLHHIEFSYTAPANRAADRIVCLTRWFQERNRMEILKIDLATCWKLDIPPLHFACAFFLSFSRAMGHQTFPNRWLALVKRFSNPLKNNLLFGRPRTRNGQQSRCGYFFAPWADSTSFSCGVVSQR